MSFTIHFFGVASNQLLMKIVALAVFWKVSSLTRTCIMKNHDSIDILRYPWSNSTTYIMSSNLNIKDVSISMKASSHLKLTLEPVSSSCSNGHKRSPYDSGHMVYGDWPIPIYPSYIDYYAFETVYVWMIGGFVWKWDIPSGKLTWS